MTPLFRRKLLMWFATHGRRLPWRKTRDPYRIWVSEIMLQQTQVDRVVLFYQNFLKKFPTVLTLAKARWPSVLAAWRGLGFYRRARNMQRTAKIVAHNLSGRFPTTAQELEKLPGIGPYTARAIAAFAYEQDVLVLDTNTSRVLSRVFGVTGKELLRAAATNAADFVPRGKSWAFHQGLMDFGAMVCTAKDPKCEMCVMRSFCGYVKNSVARQRQRGVSLSRERTRPVGVIEVAAGIIYRDGRILISRRTNGSHLAGFWEFPGGKRLAGESWRDCLKREIKEELGIEVAVRPHDWKTAYTYSDRTVHIRFHRCSILHGIPREREGQKIRWARPEELKRFRFPPANHTILVALAKARFIDPQK